MARKPSSELWQQVAEAARHAAYDNFLVTALVDIPNGLESAVLSGVLTAVATAWMALRAPGVSADMVADAIIAGLRDNLRQLEADEATKQ